MDVERIQKINNLALDLMKQGLAADKDEAIAQAEKIFRAKPDDSFSGSEMQDNSLQARPVGSSESSDNSSESGKEEEKVVLDQAKIEEILEKNVTFLVNKIKEFQEKIDSMEENMSSLRREMSKFRVANRPANAPTVAQHNPTVEQESEVSQPTPSAPTQESNTQSGPASNGNPRSGGYEEEDVSVEKFFYTGTK